MNGPASMMTTGQIVLYCSMYSTQGHKYSTLEDTVQYQFHELGFSRVGFFAFSASGNSNDARRSARRNNKYWYSYGVLSAH